MTRVTSRERKKRRFCHSLYSSLLRFLTVPSEAGIVAVVHQAVRLALEVRCVRFGEFHQHVALRLEIVRVVLALLDGTDLPAEPTALLLPVAAPLLYPDPAQLAELVITFFVPFFVRHLANKRNKHFTYLTVTFSSHIQFGDQTQEQNVMAEHRILSSTEFERCLPH